MSASGALEIHSFSPLRRYPSPSGSARSEIAETSEPASGSVSANAATAVPAATRGIHSPRVGDRLQRLGREPPGVLVQLALFWGQVQIEPVAHCCSTATPISSTFAWGSNSSVTPNRPIAG